MRNNEGPHEWWIRPVTLAGNSVRLEPASSAHIDGLWAAADHPSIWAWMPMKMTGREHVVQWLDQALEWSTREWGQAFVQIDTKSGTVVGATAYLNADTFHRRVEIGWTWITPAFQRTAINTEAKLLLMRHAFRELGANRVELKTDSENVRSRAAIVRAGAVEEGTLRNHMVRRDGSLRHTTYHSVIAQEWPAVEERLLGLIGAYGERSPGPPRQV